MKANSTTALNRLSPALSYISHPPTVAVLPFMFFSELLLSCIGRVDILLSSLSITLFKVKMFLQPLQMSEFAVYLKNFRLATYAILFTFLDVAD